MQWIARVGGSKLLEQRLTWIKKVACSVTLDSSRLNRNKLKTFGFLAYTEHVVVCKIRKKNKVWMTELMHSLVAVLRDGTKDSDERRSRDTSRNLILVPEYLTFQLLCALQHSSVMTNVDRYEKR